MKNVGGCMGYIAGQGPDPKAEKMDKELAAYFA